MSWHTALPPTKGSDFDASVRRFAFLVARRLVILAAIAYANGCTRRSPDLHALAAKAVGGRHGIVIVFNPTTCTLKDRPFTYLTAVAQGGAIRVVGVATTRPANDSAMADISRSFDIGFPLEVDSVGIWDQAIAAFGLEDPLILVLRQGRVRMILSGEGVVRWTGELPAWIKSPRERG